MFLSFQIEFVDVVGLVLSDRILRRCARGGSIHYLHCFSLDRTFGRGSCRLTRWANGCRKSWRWLQPQLRWCLWSQRRFQDPKQFNILGTILRGWRITPLFYFRADLRWHPWNLGPTDRGFFSRWDKKPQNTWSTSTWAPHRWLHRLTSLEAHHQDDHGTATGEVTTSGWP